MPYATKVGSAILCLTLLSAAAFAEIGDSVVAYWQDDGMYYFGTAVEYDDTVKGGAFLIIFEDGSQSLVPSALIVDFWLEIGTKVYARWGSGGMYPGRVANIVGNAVYVHFDDGDVGWTSLAGIALETDIMSARSASVTSFPRPS